MNAIQFLVVFVLLVALTILSVIVVQNGALALGLVLSVSDTIWVMGATAVLGTLFNQ